MEGDGESCMSINYKTPAENVKEILYANAYADLFFCFSDGRRLSAHKALLSELSPFLRKLCLEQAFYPEVCISMDQTEYESLNLLLTLIYSGNSCVSVNERTFSEIQDMACSLNITLSNVSYQYSSLPPSDSYETPEDYEDYFIDEYNEEEVQVPDEQNPPPRPLAMAAATSGRPNNTQSKGPTMNSNNKEYSLHVCPKCFKVFERKSRLREHFAVHYSFEIENEAVNCGIYAREHRYFCLLCKKKLRDNRIFSYHMGYVHKLLLPHISDDPLLASKLFNLKVPIHP